MPRIVAALAASAFLAVACNESAPSLPTDPGTPGVPSIVITVTSDRMTLNAGSEQAATITIAARAQDGSAVPDQSSIAINTNLGHFGLDAAGAPQKITTAKLIAGVATVQFYAGSETGTANLLVQLGTSVGKLNLAIADPLVAPVADFTFDIAGLRVLFVDASTGSPSKWKWTFGDGTDSTASSPAHDYSAPATYTVTLTVENSGGSSSKSKFVTIAAPPPLVASFTSVVNGLSVLFTDTSTGGPQSWEWNFGDRTFSTAQNPQHDYLTAGTYTVSLTARGNGQVSTASAFVTVGGTPPVADFKFDVAGLRAIFTDASTGSPTSWKWDFGDNTPIETAQNPTHDYARSGTYTVKLTATNVAGSTEKSQFVAVSAGDAPKASFTVQVVGLDAAFTDTSTGAPTAWRWNFGDGSALDTRQNPTHRYAAAGTYTVTLEASNAAGASTVSQLVTTATAPTAAFSFSYLSEDTLTLSFVDQSSGGPTAWQWNFGDCGASAECTSNLQNPTHTYSAPGRYTVVLTASNASGQSSKQSIVRAGLPEAEFTCARNGLQVTFTDQTTNDPTGWRWSFGDCELCTSTEQNPVHVYEEEGTYTVTLRAGNAAGESIIERSITVPCCSCPEQNSSQ